MRRMILLSLPMLLGAPGLASAQSTMPGGQPVQISQERAAYNAHVRVHVETLLAAWTKALNTRDLKRLAGCYDQEPVVILSTGNRLNGNRAVTEGYGRLLPRMTKVRVDIEKIIANGSVASVFATLTYEVPLPGGGSYPRSTQMRFGLRAPVGDDYEITAQEGGDLVIIAVAGSPPAVIAPGASDSLRVRITDATGAGVAGVSVMFEVADGHGTLASAPVHTDAQGIAAVAFTAGAEPEPNLVRARAAPLEEEPVFFQFKTGVATP